MFITHFSHFGMRVSGLYESTKDQVKYERKEGHRSELLDPFNPVPRPDQVDEWLRPIHWEEAKTADVWVLHSCFLDRLKKWKKNKVTVGVMHGPTEHLLLKKWHKGAGSLDVHIDMLWQQDATVALNQHEYDIMKFYDEKRDDKGKGRLVYIPNSVDLERFKDVYSWKYNNRPAIITCDTPRIEKLPFHIFWAMPKVVEKIPTARLNAFSLLLEPIQIWRNLLCRAHGRKLEKCCENIQMANQDLRPFQAGADIGFNNNYSGIASRVTMEMMAQGVPVVSYGGDYTKYHARIFDIPSISHQIIKCWKELSEKGSTVKADTIKYAKENFDRGKEVKKYIELYERLLVKKRELCT